MSQYDIIMYTVSMQSEISSLNLYLSCYSISYTKKMKATFEQLLDFGATFEQLLEFWSNFWATFWENWSKFLRKLGELVDSPGEGEEEEILKPCIIANRDFLYISYNE